MFKKGPDIDKKKLLSKASDVKKDSLTRLKHFKTLIEHIDKNELQVLFKSHFSFIYHTFIDTFSTFDYNSKQRRDDLDCILFMLEKILVHNPDLIKKRWQFYSITFVMQKLLHPNNTWQLRQEGIRLFVLWYQILCDEQNTELQVIFATLVPGIVPKTSLPNIQTTDNVPTSQQSIYQHPKHNKQQQSDYQGNITQLPIKLCNIDPLVPATPNDQFPNGDVSLFYLDCLLQHMITQTTKPFWMSQDETRRNQELSFAFIFNMFKKIYLEHLFTNFSAMLDFSSITKSSYHSNVDRYLNNQSNATEDHLATNMRQNLNIDLKQNDHPIDKRSPVSERTGFDQDRTISLSNYQAIVIKWLTRILRQDMILVQDDLTLRAGSSSSVDRSQRDSQSQDSHQRGISSGPNDSESNLALSGANQSSAMVHNIESSSREMDIARRIIGTWPENITVVHELFRRAFLNFHQPASMKRVVNVYKEWICNDNPNNNQTNQVSPKSPRLGYSSKNDLLQVFVLNSSNAFLTFVHTPTMLDDQFEMCRRIMNIYRFMVMKIFMNTQTWEQLLNVMLQITEHLFPVVPPERKELTIGGRIAPAFFQTFLVSWIRANLYVHISEKMWDKFHGVLKNLVRWRELVEEWSNTMGSLTRVLVNQVYGLSLNDLPLDRPQDRRRRPRAMKSLSTAEVSPTGDTTSEAAHQSQSNRTQKADSKVEASAQRQRSDSVRLQTSNSVRFRDMSRTLTRSNSDGLIEFKDSRLYYSSAKKDSPLITRYLRKIKSEYLVSESQSGFWSGRRSSSPMVHSDAIDGSSLKDSNLIIEHDQGLDSHQSGRSVYMGGDKSETDNDSSTKRPDSRINQENCVLLGGTIRGWTKENSVIMWRRMLGLFGDINRIEDPENHLITIECLASIIRNFIRTRENLGISLDNHQTPEQPELVPPYTYPIAWLLKATQLPIEYKESYLMAYKLLCMMSIRRHDIELPTQYYAAFYESLYRGFVSSDIKVHASIIENCSQILSLECPGSTILVQVLYERSRSILLSTSNVGISNLVGPNYQHNSHQDPIPKDQAIQILSSILALYRPMRKLMVLKPESSNSMNLVAPGDIKSKIFETLLNCNTRSSILDINTRSKSLCSICIHVYQELSDKHDSVDVEKLIDLLLNDLQDSSNTSMTRVTCDILRLLSDYALVLASSRPAMVSSLIQIICQQIARCSMDDENKEIVEFLISCLEDWCMSVNKTFLSRPIELQLDDDDRDGTLSRNSNDSIIAIVLRTLDNVIHDEQFVDDVSQHGTRDSIVSASRTSDTHSSSRHSQGRNSDSEQDPTGCRDGRTLTNDRAIEQQTAVKDRNFAIKLACRVSHMKLITYIGHFPLPHVGPASMSCCVNELDYLSHPCATEQESALDFNGSAGMSLLVLNGSTIVSFIGSTNDETDGHYRPLRMIIRNLCGKYSWSASCIGYDSINNNRLQSTNRENQDSIIFDADSFQEISPGSMKYDSDYNDDCNLSSSLSSRSSSNRDCIEDLMNCINSSLSSPSANQSMTSYQQLQRKRNSTQSISNSRLRIAQAEETMFALLTHQRCQELKYNDKYEDSGKVIFNLKGSNCPSCIVGNNSEIVDNTSKQESPIITMEQCRQLVQQLGYLTWDKRLKIETLAKNQRLLRELKNLDARPNRETHKIAVIYVANGQEDKTSILMNSSGSRAFEDFVSGLGWEVNLANHLGFKGGLQSNKSTGETSTYYCNATTEVMFHVSTKIPVEGPADNESLNRKLRHLGNDEIHIVWSEHTRDYRRGIIPTEFGDVIITIYPMITFQGYYRIQILCKDDVPIFGPLFDNCIVQQASLAPLVRATAINASRAKRINLPHYQSHFEERSRLIDSIVQNHKERLSFEEFAMQLYNKSELKPKSSTDRVAASATATCC